MGPDAAHWYHVYVPVDYHDPFLRKLFHKDSKTGLTLFVFGYV
jgi:hypothetical protein